MVPRLAPFTMMPLSSNSLVIALPFAALMVWGKGSCCSFPVNTELFCLSIHHMVFNLRNIVADVIDQIQLQILGSPMKNLFKCLSHPMGDHLPLGEGKVGGTGHCLEILLSFWGRNRSTTELGVWKFNLIFPGSIHHDTDVIITYLVAQTS